MRVHSTLLGLRAGKRPAATHHFTVFPLGKAERGNSLSPKNLGRRVLSHQVEMFQPFNYVIWAEVKGG